MLLLTPRQLTFQAVCVVALVITEQPWSFQEVNWLAWALPAALVCVPVRRGRRPDGAPLAVPATDRSA